MQKYDAYLLQHLKIIVAKFFNYNCNIKNIFLKKIIEQIELVNYIKNVQHATISRINLCNVLKQLLQHHLKHIENDHRNITYRSIVQP